ncbi:MAG: 50S ribosomal protein L15 [bacterium]|nr:50S ribosomal protein L15 [bacterium]
MKLHEIKAPAGLRKRGKRVGRGPGSGRGKTSGRGTKGEKARSGKKLRVWFEGGQTPLYRRVPKRGFVNPRKLEYQIINVQELNRFPEGTEVNFNTLKDMGLVKKKNLPIKILGKGKVKIPLSIKVDRISKGAREKIEAVGGEVMEIG